MALLNNEGSFSCQIEWHCWSSTFIHCIIIIWSHSCYNEPAEYLIGGTMNEFAIYGECRMSIPLCLTSLLLSAFFSVCWTQDQTRRKNYWLPIFFSIHLIFCATQFVFLCMNHRQTPRNRRRVDNVWKQWDDRYRFCNIYSPVWIIISGSGFIFRIWHEHYI